MPEPAQPPAGGTYEVIAVRYGTRTSAKSENYLNYHLYGEPDADVTMAYYFWIARNADRTVVIDTGFDTAVGVRRGRTSLIEPRYALTALGVDTVDQVVATHGHYDHIGNLDLFPTAEVVVDRREYEFWHGPYGDRLLFAAPTELAELRQLTAIRDEGRLTLTGERHDVAPGIEAVRVGGHTPGQLVVTVATADGTAILASDAVHFYEEYELGRPFSVIADLEEMYRAYDLLAEMSQDRGRVLIAGHDPADADRFGLVDPSFDFALRIG
ncbi:MAG: MBL fold metallo-hydrolase [Streptosporangiales bacterium]|nr:MBL fold metallo-hydrolase [Streptosporangiales bacterium]